jgi:hypothetical protein
VSGKADEPRRFGEVLARLLLERPEYTTALHGPNWSHFAHQLPDVSYESLRKAVTGERTPPGMKIMEAVAEALSVEPSVFVEWRKAKVLERVEALNDAAVIELEDWLNQHD